MGKVLKSNKEEELDTKMIKINKNGYTLHNKFPFFVCY